VIDGHKYSRKCWCDGCRSTGMIRLLNWLLFFLTVALLGYVLQLTGLLWELTP
jgi:hypothetical protein